MQKQSLDELINQIAELFRKGFPSSEELDSFDTFGLDDPLSLIGKNRKLFQSAVDDLIKSFQGVKDTVSRKTFVEALVALIRESKATGQSVTPAKAEEFKKMIHDLPLQRYQVLRPINGVEMSPDAGLIQFGDFQIDFGRRLLVSKHDNKLLAMVVEEEDRSKLFIQCTIPARDTEIAEQLADAFFYRFELIFRFLIGERTERVEVGIVNYRGAQMRDNFIFSEDGRPVGHGSAWKGAWQPFILDDQRFPQPTPAITRLFELITRPNNDFEKHIIRCAEWIGQAIGEPNEAAALVKAAIALEVLFSTNEKGPITPSITAQISESCAFLLGNEKASPLEIERKVKRLYGVRSSVVHSGKDSVDPKDLHDFIEICRSAVIRLLSDSEFAAMESMVKLAEYFRMRKYGVLKQS